MKPEQLPEAQRGSDRYDEWRERRDLERWEAEQELKEKEMKSYEQIAEKMYGMWLRCHEGITTEWSALCLPDRLAWIAVAKAAHEEFKEVK